MKKIYLVFITLGLFTSCTSFWYIGFAANLKTYKIDSPEYPAYNWELKEHPDSDEIYDGEKPDGLKSVLVINNGDLIVEWYANGYNKDKPINIKSASKSIISALVGIALEKGLIKSLDQPIIEIIPEYFPNPPEEKQEITIRHLLTMSAGFDHIENVNNYVYSESNWTRGILELSLIDFPGTKYNYGTVQSHLLSAVITEVSGMDTLAFAQKNLFDEMNISINRWDSAPEGIFFGGSEMYMTPRDMAAFGLLYLNKGVFEGDQLIPEEWVEESFRPKYKNVWYGADYGFYWWIKEVSGYEVKYALGYGCQIIYLIPEKEMIVVLTGDTPLFLNHIEREEQFEQFLTQIIRLDF